MIKASISGVIRSGKNHVARMMELPEVGFADPIKAYVDQLAPPGSTKEFLRRAYQDFGQWGRGSLDIPFSAERAIGVQMARLAGSAQTGMGTDDDWIDFGTRPDFWVRLLLSRIRNYYAGVAVCDVRFANEALHLKDEGFVHIHVMCSEETRAERAGDNWDPSVLENVSEKFARGIDSYVRETGGHENVDYIVWNDHRAPYPAMKDFLTLEEFIDSAIPQIFERQSA